MGIRPDTTGRLAVFGRFPWRDPSRSSTLTQRRHRARIRPPLACGLRWSGAVIPPCGSRDSRKAVAVNKRHDFARLEREFITSDISLRALCRKHNISARSLVTVQAKKNDWAGKREAYQAKETDSFIETYADRMADRRAEISDKFLDAIDEAITKFRTDMKATKLVRQPDGSITEEPVMRLTPKDVSILIDRFQVLFEKPSLISQHQGLTASSEFSTDALREFIEATRGMEAPARMDASPLPRSRRLDD